MCGITGVVNFDRNRKVDKDKVYRMTSIIQHRGPDGEGFYFNRNIGLGHRRLSIIDLETGDQPMISEDGKRILVFNGEIYNYIEIRKDLIKRGHSFKTQSDTEVIMKSYEECKNLNFYVSPWERRVNVLVRNTHF